MSGARGNGGLLGGTPALGWDCPGASRSPPAHVTAPKYPTHFLPNRTLTLQAGTRKIFSFFFSLPTPPPPSQPASLLPLPPSLLPPLPPAPAQLPPWCPGAGGRRVGGRGSWARRPGAPGSLPLPFAGLPWLHPREARQGWQKRSVSWAHDATLSLWHFPPSSRLGGLAQFSGQAVIQLRPVSGTSPEQAMGAVPRAPRGGVMEQECAGADVTVFALCLAFSCRST